MSDNLTIFVIRERPEVKMATPVVEKTDPLTKLCCSLEYILKDGFNKGVRKKLTKTDIKDLTRIINKLKNGERKA